MKLEGRLILGFFIAVMISFGLTIYFLSNTQLDALYAISEKESQSTYRLITNASQDSNEDFLAFLDAFSQSQRYEVVLFTSDSITFFNEQHNTRKNVDELLNDPALSQEAPSFDQNQRRFVMPVVVEGKTYVVFLQRVFTYEQMVLNRILLYAFMSISIAGTAVFVFLAEIIVQPIKRLIKATRQLSKGDYDVRVNVDHRTNEMAELSENFNLLALELGSLEEKRQQFVSDISHELQTPITSIQGFANILKDDDLPDDQRNRYLEIIIQQSKRLSSLSKSMINLAMLEGESIKEFSTFKLNELLKDVLMSCEPTIKERHIELTSNLDEVMIEADYGQLEQVFTNILTNALKYSNHAGKVNLSLKKTRKEAIIVVEDFGIGIPKETLHRIFERFYRAESARHETGSGLGLAIVKRIVSLHLGHIDVESKEHEGTKVTIRLPLEQKQVKGENDV